MRHPLTVSYGHMLFKHRNWIFTVVTILLLVAFEPSVGRVGGIPGWAIDLLGVAIVLAGAVVRGAVVGLAYIKRGGINKKIAAETLVTQGLFDHCRNPLYVGNLLIVAGLFVVHGNPIAMGLAAAFFGYSYYAITMAEEGFLRRKFGAAYEVYCARVSRWAIRLEGLAKTFAAMRFDWRRVIVKEYTTTFTWNVTLLAIVAYELLIQGSLSANMPAICFYAGFLLMAVLIVKYAKSYGILREMDPALQARG